MINPAELSYRSMDISETQNWSTVMLRESELSAVALRFQNLTFTSEGRLLCIDPDTSTVFALGEGTQSDIIRAARRIKGLIEESVALKGRGTNTEVEGKYALDFMTAGRATFTIQSNKTQAYFTYTLKRLKNKGEYSSDGSAYFCSVQSGGKDVYAGLVTERETIYKFVRGKKGTMEADEPRIAGLLKVLNLLAQNKTIPAKIYHTGICGRCGRRLSTPDSLKTGLGPECIKHSGES